MMMEEEMQKKATMKCYEERQCVIQSALTRLEETLLVCFVKKTKM